ncbi:pyridoxamine 5'-phosphate oxidase family protein [Kribbella monticola]|uniref:pyridoxamine 5'-phosphate oxidase family protein n=1 Tax=Kribbella monticola TaxID=2185285 RepID=UPI000DD32D46|nr:pyridoxamine 5'-phosphate oxidase family protein [Kribbella monticola]
MDKTATPPQTTLGPFSVPGADVTPWEDTELALRRIHKFQLCTVRRDGRPHVTPLLAIWAFGAMWFTTGAEEQKAKNLAANQHCVLTAGTETLTGTDYVIEGTATLVTDQSTREAAADAFEESYGWQITRKEGTWHHLSKAVRSGDAQLYRVQPTKAFAFTTTSRSAETRYTWT